MSKDKEHPKNVENMVKSAKKKTIETRNKAIKAIEKMIDNDENITFYSVNKKTRISKTFLYKDEVVSNLINKNRTKKQKRIQTDDSKDVVIETQNRLIKELQEENNQLKKSLVYEEDYKEKYEKALYEIDELKKQLRKSYEY